MTSLGPKNRIVCHFSCGAASAVATKLAISRFGHKNLVIYNAFIVEEHPDNRRFLADCSKWFNHPITVLESTKYGASVHVVWRTKRFMNSFMGASCSSALKREILDRELQSGDINVFGFTADERRRAQRFLDCGGVCPLIDANLTKDDCLEMVHRAGIELPAMYRLGFNNANCIGCCKGGEGYWNKIRAVFPERFAEVVAIQEEIGPGSYFFRNRKTGERIGLKNLKPDAGRHDEPVPSCSFFCEMAEDEIEKGS